MESFSYENGNIVSNKQKNVENAVNPQLKRYIHESYNGNRLAFNNKVSMDNSDPTEMGPVYGHADRRLEIWDQTLYSDFR